MNPLFVQESVTGADVFNFPVWIEPSIVNFPVSVSERFAYTLRVHTDVREFPILSLRVDWAAHLRQRENLFFDLVSLATLETDLHKTIIQMSDAAHTGTEFGVSQEIRQRKSR